MVYIWLIAGFVLLVKGADFFVDGSASVARLLRVPSVVIGLTIVAMGTSAPEAAVSITAGLTGNNDIAFSNVIGSNAFNLLVVVGVCACIKAFPVDREVLKRDFPVCIVATVVLLLFALDGGLSRLDGVILLLLMAAYLAYTVRSALRGRRPAEENREKISPVKSILFIIGGLAAVIIGGDLVVDSASSIAESFGLSQTLIGLTIIAVGTSLPELVTSIVAARKGESGLAIGNVVGSNLFNILFILGMSSVVRPITVSAQSLVNTALALLFTAGLLALCRIRGVMRRPAGAVCLLAYLGFTVYSICFA